VDRLRVLTATGREYVWWPDVVSPMMLREVRAATTAKQVTPCSLARVAPECQQPGERDDDRDAATRPTPRIRTGKSSIHRDEMARDRRAHPAHHVAMTCTIGRMRLNTFLNFGGNCEEAFRFYEQHLGGRITMLMRRSEQPDQPATWPGWEKTVQYAYMDLGETQLMASDVPPDRFQPMRSVYLSLTVDSAAEAERLWALLSEGGQVFMPMEETFFATRFGQLRDRFGTSWMILALKPQPR
jgi:PhnB protein